MDLLPTWPKGARSGRGVGAIWQAVSACCSIAGKKGRQKEKLLFFPRRRTSNWELVVIEGEEMGKKIHQLGLIELQVPEKPNPTGLKKGILGSHVEKSRGSLAPGTVVPSASTIDVDLSISPFRSPPWLLHSWILHVGTMAASPISFQIPVCW